MDGLERGKEAERVATDIAKDAGVGILLQDLVKGGIDVTMTATLAELRRTAGQVGARLILLARGQTEGLLQLVGRQLTRARQLAREATLDDGITIHDTTHLLLNEGLALLDDQDGVALGSHAAHQLLRQRILRDLQDGIGHAVGIALVEVVESNTARDDTQRVVLAGILLQLSLLACDNHVALAGKGGKQHPVAGLGLIVQGVLLTRRLRDIDHGT